MHFSEGKIGHDLFKPISLHTLATGKKLKKGEKPVNANETQIFDCLDENSHDNFQGKNVYWKHSTSTEPIKLELLVESIRSNMKLANLTTTQSEEISPKVFTFYSSYGSAIGC